MPVFPTRKVMKKYDAPTNNLIEFVEKHICEDPAEIALRHAGRVPGVDLPLASVQIGARRKTARKLASFTEHRDFLFPSMLAAEQATDENVARYHAKLAGKGKKIADLTAGLGIDAFTLAKAGNNVTAVELDSDRYRFLIHNAGALDIEGLRGVNADCLEWLSEGKGAFDLIFIDPARRDQANRRTYFFSDCLPDITTHRALLLSKAKTVMIKASPIIDFTQAKREFPEITEFHIVSRHGECKEVLCIAQRHGAEEDPLITVVDLDTNSSMSLRLSERGHGSTPIACNEELKAGYFLHDPSAALHKADCGNVLCTMYPGLKRVAPETDLYISAMPMKDFIGRIFRIEDTAYKKKSERINVAVRNFPLTAPQLESKLKAKPGDGTKTTFGMRTGMKSKPTIVLCTKLERNLL